MLQQLDLTNFRSYRDIKLQIEKPLVVILGPNAVGKTNLLESIHVAATTHSFRARDRDIIHYGEQFYRVVAGFESGDQEVRFVTEGDSHRKSVLLAGSKRPLVSVVGLNPVTIFEPNDMNLLTGPPEGRRKYLDTVLSQLDHSYVTALSNYRKILRQRNSLLHQAKLNQKTQKLDDHLFVWDIQLVEPAVMIVKKRQDFISSIARLVRDYYQKISGWHGDLEIIYLPHAADEKAAMLQQLKDGLQKDLQAGFTTTGPHRDDFTVKFKSNEIAKIASRGELRTIILALKLSEMDYIESKLSKRPILLLDDVFSELDGQRREFLVASIDGQQTIITTTDIDATLQSDYQLIDLSGSGYVA